MSLGFEKVHHAKLVRAWLEKHKSEIELFFLPPYSPQHNPDECLNGNLKRELAKKGYSKDVDELESKARGAMKTGYYTVLNRDDSLQLTSPCFSLWAGWFRKTTCTRTPRAASGR
ncbi:MAG: transposase [Clostridiales bacterium]|nr:transposase [Clostridiales bacterium]